MAGEVRYSTGLKMNDSLCWLQLQFRTLGSVTGFTIYMSLNAPLEGIFAFSHQTPLPS